MTLYQKLRDDREALLRNTARSYTEQVKMDLLKLIIARAQATAKNDLRDPIDADALEAAKYYNKGARDTVLEMEKRDMSSDPRYVQALHEVAIVAQYLPAQMSTDQTKDAIRAEIGSIETFKIGPVIGALKKRFGDTINPSMAKELVETYRNTWN